MNQRSISWGELAKISEFAKNKFSYITEQNERDLAVLNFVGRYINGGKFVVYNGRDQLLAYFDILDDAIAYIEENEPKNELFSIECEILN